MDCNTDCQHARGGNSHIHGDVMCGLHGSFLWANFTWAGYLFRVFQGMPYMSRVSFWCWLKNLGWQLPFSGWNAIFSHKLCLYHHHNVTKTVIMIQYLLSLTWAGYVFCIIRSRPYISGSSFPDLGRTSRLLAYLVNPPRPMASEFDGFVCNLPFRGEHSDVFWT